MKTNATPVAPVSSPHPPTAGAARESLRELTTDDLRQIAAGRGAGVSNSLTPTTGAH